MGIRKIGKRILASLLVLFVLMNVLASIHAYKFTHFSHAGVKTKDALKLSTTEKLETAILGVNNPRPVNTTPPSQPYETVSIQSNVKLECWHIKTDSSLGTVLLFHGYGSDKSKLIDRSDEFIRMKYDVLLVDFMGSGGSEGDVTTIGYKEAQNVKDCYDYIVARDKRPIYLFGSSMGSAAILKSINDYHFNPTGVIVECPFGSMYKTTCARFTGMHIPSFPMAGLLLLWGGGECGFWAMGHNPTEYAKAVKCPTLLMAGGRDEKVSKEEIDEIYANLAGLKTLKTYSLAKHENYFRRYKDDWIKDVTTFMK
jgi:alpha-beta hydrolase superfamily lysophospholipase